MTRPIDPLFDQRIADWLEDDPVRAPRQVLDVVLAAIPSIPRRRASRAPWTITPISAQARLAAAAVLGVVAVAGALYLMNPSQRLIVGGSPLPPAQATATAQASSRVGPTVERGAQTATLLADGRVLIAGGYASGGTALASAEIFDAASHTFSAAGSMTAARAEQTATMLADGRVLVAGGRNSADGSLASAEVYDPRTGRFTVTGSMVEARAFHTATLLLDGRVLVTSGEGTSAPLATAEIYDPRTGTFSPTGSMATAGSLETATLLDDGRVLVAGGGIPQGSCFATAEIFDPGTGTFSTTASMTTPRCGHTATLLDDGRVLVAGGTFNWIGDSFQASAEIFDPRTGTFAPTGPLAHAPAKQTATMLRDGRVLIVGGNEVGNHSLQSAEVFDPATGSFSLAGSMATARTLHAATILPDGRVLVVGGTSLGWTLTGPFLDSAETYDPATGTFTPAG